MKGKIIARIAINSLLIVLMVSILVGFLAYDNLKFTGRKDSSASAAKEEISSLVPSANPILLQKETGNEWNANLYSADSISVLEINWVSGKIEILPDDVAEIQVVESPSDMGMVIKQSGSTLEINFSEEKKIGFNSRMESKDLSIVVPREWVCQELEVNAASSALYVYGLTMNDVELNTASGNITFLDCTAEDLRMESASGALDFSGCINTLEMDGVSADAIVRLDNVPQAITMDSASGKLDITLPSDAGFQLEKSGINTSVESEFATSASGDKLTCGDGRCKIEFSGISGKVCLHKGDCFACTGNHHNLTAVHHSNAVHCSESDVHEGAAHEENHHDESSGHTAKTNHSDSTDHH